MRLTLVIGTRPEAIKLAPVALAARDMDCRIVLTGQHERMAADALAAFGLSADRTLSVPPAGSLGAMERALEAALGEAFSADQPDMVLVQGDTASAVAGARAAKALRLPLGHVEAGLRSYDLAQPFPEEGYRVEIDRLADLLFAPTPEAAANLAAEPHATGAVIVTGNTGIDALVAMRGTVSPRPVPHGKRLVLVTCHRRESFGAGIDRICEAVRRLAGRGDLDLLVPVHPNPAAGGAVRAALAGLPGVTPVAPLPYPEMVAAMMASHLILSDSGGVQEEAPTLGVPVLVLRDVTERPEGLAANSLALVGTDPDRIVAAATRLLDDPIAHAAMAQLRHPYGDGRAAARILAAIEAFRSR